MKQLIVCALLFVAVAVTLGAQLKVQRAAFHVHFEIKHQLGDIKPHLEPLRMAIHEHMARKLQMEKEFIKNLKLMPKGTTIVIVEFEAHHNGKVDVKEMLLIFKTGLAHHTCGIHYHGHIMHPSPESFHMKEMHHKEGGGWSLWKHCKSHRMYMYGGGFLLILLIIVIVVAVTVTCCCIRKRRAAACARARGCNFKKNLTMDNNPYVVMPEEKKVPLE